MKSAIKTKNIPTLRFPGFLPARNASHSEAGGGEPDSAKATTGSWEEKRLGEVAKFWNGKAHEQDISDNGKYIVVNSKFISQNGKVKKYSDSQASPLKKDDIAIVMSDIPGGKAIGKCFLVDQDEKYTLNQRIGGIKSKEISSSFLIRILNRNKYFLKFDNGVSQTNLRKDEILRCPVVFPTLPEQQKIAGFLGAVDEWIENLRAQKKSLAVYKKGMMQKIFAQELRFKDESGKSFTEWEEKKLSNIFDIFAGKTKSLHINGTGKNVIVDMGGISSDGKLIANKYTDYSDDFLTTNDLVMPKDDIGGGMIIGKVARIPENKKYICGDHIFKLTKKIGDVGFLFYAINSFNISRSFRRKANGTAQLGLSKGSVENQKIPFPPIPEQQKIAEFLTSIDNLIESKQQQITQAELWKKGLMQGLFV